MKHPSPTIILPTYNEAENIIVLIREIQRYTPAGSTILVVDDNSPDGTAHRVRRFIKSHKAQNTVRLMVRSMNRGLTNSLIDGIATAKSDVILWMDCDFSHPPSMLPKLIHTIEIGADIAIASRVNNTGFSRILNSITQLLFGRNITDYTTGFLAARRRVLTRIPLRGNYGEYCIDLLVRAQAAGYRIDGIPYGSPPRRRGITKTAPTPAAFIRHGVGYIFTLLRLLWVIKVLRKPTV